MHKKDAIALVNLRGPEVIKFGSLISPEGVDIRHTVKVGGGSFTDGRRMETGLFDFMINDEEDEYEPTFKMSHGLYSLKGVTAHEYGHVWFTKFTEMKNLIEKIGAEFDKEGIESRFSRGVIQHVFNSTEDGRIEKRMVNLYPGLINYFRYNNGTIWKLDPEEFNASPENELANFLRCVVVYSVIGLRPRWYKNTKGTRLRDEVEKILPMIDEAIDAPTCKKNSEKVYEIIHACWDYLLELLREKQKNQKEMEELLEQLQQQGGAGGNDIQEGQSGVGDGTSAGEGSESARMGKNGEEGEEGQTEGTSKNKCGDNSGSAGSTVGRKTEIPEWEDIDEMSTDGTPRDYSGISGDGGGSTKVIKSKAGHTSVTPEQMIEKAITEAEGLADKEATKEPTKSKEPKVTSSTMTKEEVNRMVTAVGYDREHIRTYREERSRYKMIPIDDALKPAVAKFRSKVENCFSKKNQLLTKMSSGKLDTRQLYRLGMKEYNVFQKLNNRSLTDAVVEICWDGSGSMYGGKQKLSAQACAIVEDGLKGLVPLKIINFTTDWDNQEVVHYLVKDFDEKSPNINYSLSYARSKGFNGGNKDGYSIRVCTEDLMKRKEKDKILIVMSDGLPSDYNSINPQDDVKDAVKCARKNGIIVIPIFFGDEYFRERELSAYEYMYEKNLINSGIEELPTRLVKLFEKLILR